MGSPSEYLHRVGSISDIALDYALAARFRKQDVSAVSDGLADDLRRLGTSPGSDQVSAVALQWLVRVTSSR